MKKTITLMLLLAIAGSANADLVLQKMESSISVCPSLFSADGFSVAYSCDYSTGDIIIYDQDFHVNKSFTCVTSECQSGNVTEEATVIPTGVKVATTYYAFGNQYNNYDTEPLWEAHSQEEMVSKLNELYPNETFTTFTDYFGNPACFNNSADFAFENFFGKKYPRKWYALIDGMAYIISTYDQGMYGNPGFYSSVTYDEESAVWIRTSENLSTSYGTVSSALFRIDGVDVGNIAVSQTFFNDDEKWEYLIPEYGPLEFSSSPSINVQANNDGTVTLKRSGYASSSNIGYAVYNEDGEKLGNILGRFSNPEFSGLVFNGRKFIRTYSEKEGLSYLYEIKNGIDDIDLVEMIRTKDDCRLGAARGIVTVDISAEQADGEVVVSTTDGKVMASKKVGMGQTQVNDQPLPTGIYVVSLLKDGRVVESEKYLVQ